MPQNLASICLLKKITGFGFRKLFFLDIALVWLVLFGFGLFRIRMLNERTVLFFVLLLFLDLLLRNFELFPSASTFGKDLRGVVVSHHVIIFTLWFGWVFCFTEIFRLLWGWFLLFWYFFSRIFLNLGPPNVLPFLLFELGVPFDSCCLLGPGSEIS